MHALSAQIKINATGSVEDLVKELSKSFKNLIYHPYEYALQVVRDDENIWLTRRAPLCEQVRPALSHALAALAFSLIFFVSYLQLLSSDEHVILRRYVFLSDSLVDYSKQTYVLDFLYLECRKSDQVFEPHSAFIFHFFCLCAHFCGMIGMVTGKHPVTLPQAVQFAALQMQAQYVLFCNHDLQPNVHSFNCARYEDYDPLVHVADYLKLTFFSLFVS